MPRNQRVKINKRVVGTAKAKALISLNGEARKLYEKSLDKWDKKLKPLTDSIRGSQLLSKEDFDIRINTRD